MQLKDRYSAEFFEELALVVDGTVGDFDADHFRQLIFDEQWEERELKDRMRHTAAVLGHFLPSKFTEAAPLIIQLARNLERSPLQRTSLECMFLAHFIETNGLDHFTASIKAMEAITPFTSCEFAVRPFILRYGSKMMQQMERWSLHKNLHVRRLASEGSRPRLPWAIALPPLKQDPTPIFPILENLRQDPSEYVRRSVANNLNDIARDHPDHVIGIAQKWKGQEPATDAIIRHGVRTLLKQGDERILHLYGLHHGKTELLGFELAGETVPSGGELQFSFTVRNRGKKTQVIRLEYAMYYLRQHGRISKKVFKISERPFAAGEEATLTKRHSFRPITTRRYYPGLHQVSLIVNGREHQRLSFHLK